MTTTNETPAQSLELIDINATPTTMDAHTRAEYDIQIATAKKFPRSLAEFKRRATEMATLDKDTAASCLYAVPRKDKNIEGESIRLAEIVASTYGNIIYGARTLGKDLKTTKVVGFAWDLENNVRVMIEKEGRITDRFGKTYNDDMQTVTTNATIAKAVRDAIFKVVPKSLIKDVVNNVKSLLIGDIKGMEQRRDRALESFLNNFYIDEKTICEIFDIKGKADITSELLLTLHGFHTALKEADPAERKTMIESMRKPLAQQTQSTETPKAKI